MRAKKWGRIINISSIIAFTGTDHEAHYAAKAAVVGLTKSLALELASYNITVNAIAPGWIETDMTSSITPEEKKKALELIPLRRMGQPEDIAHVATFLASEKASFITGQTIHVNGGSPALITRSSRPKRTSVAVSSDSRASSRILPFRPIDRRGGGQCNSSGMSLDYSRVSPSSS